PQGERSPEGSYVCLGNSRRPQTRRKGVGRPCSPSCTPPEVIESRSGIRTPERPRPVENGIIDQWAVKALEELRRQKQLASSSPGSAGGSQALRPQEGPAAGEAGGGAPEDS